MADASRVEMLLENILGGTNDVIPQSRVEILLKEIAESGGGGGGGDSYAVKYISQSLNDSQKSQARTNIGAASVSDIGTVFKIKGSVASENDLPASENAVGDVYYVVDVSAGFVWLQTTAHPTGYWEELGESIDLSAYQLKPTITEVTGSTPTITAADNTIYSCGEVSSLTISDSAQNISFVVEFTSGSTPTALTVPSGYKAPGGDLTPEASKTYELNVRNGKAVLTAFEAVSTGA